MKKLTVILSILLFVSCQKDEACSCSKEFHEIETTIYWVDGLPHTNVQDYIVGSEKVVCQDEQRMYTSGFTYYDIKCN
jgi:hypothetical protein